MLISYQEICAALTACEEKHPTSPAPLYTLAEGTTDVLATLVATMLVEGRDSVDVAFLSERERQLLAEFGGVADGVVGA